MIQKKEEAIAIYNQIDQHFRENRDRLVKSMIRNAGSIHGAEDVVQEAYTRACEYCKSHSVHTSIDALIQSIMGSALKNYQREEITRGATSGYVFEEERCGGQYDRVRLMEVMEKMEELRESHVVILKLAFLFDYTALEIDKLVPDSLGSIKVIVHRFRKKLEEEGV